jgi:hypothetical protein
MAAENRFQHGYTYDVFLSYASADDEPELEDRQWVTEFERDLKSRLRVITSNDVKIWRDLRRMTASDNFGETILRAVQDSALLLTVLSPRYFASDYCKKEREAFCERARHEGREFIGNTTNSRIVKAAKYHVDKKSYPEELRKLLEYRFFEIDKDTGKCTEFHLHPKADVRAARNKLIDDLAQEIVKLLTAFDGSVAPAEPKGMVYLAETSSDLELEAGNLRRSLKQAGYDVEPKVDLRLKSAGELRSYVSEKLEKCQLTIHPVGASYGFIPDGESESAVQIQLELARSTSRNGSLPKIIWVPNDLVVKQDAQKHFLECIRTEYAGRGFELLEATFDVMATRVEDRLKPVAATQDTPAARSNRCYLVCANLDRSLAKTVRAFLANRKMRVEWTPAEFDSATLGENHKHLDLLRRNGVHLVLHGQTGDDWIQDRIGELDDVRQTGTGFRQAICLANPERDDKSDLKEFLTGDISLLEAYTTALGDVLSPFVDELTGGMPSRTGAQGRAQTGGLS